MKKIKLVFGPSSSDNTKLKELLCADREKTLRINVPKGGSVYRKRDIITAKISAQLEESHQLIVIGNFAFENGAHLEVFIYEFFNREIEINPMGKDRRKIPAPQILFLLDYTPVGFVGESIFRRIELVNLSVIPYLQLVEELGFTH